MIPHMPRKLIVAAVGLLTGWASVAGAQDLGSRRVVFDTVIGVQDVFRETREWPTQVIVDTFVSAELRPGLQLSFRPVLWRTSGEWHQLVDQISIQQQFHKGSDWRIEAGRFPSPMGLGMMENRASINPGVLWCHRPYYMPLPELSPDAPRVSLASAVYPSGVNIATSSDRWDARAAFVDTAPVSFWHNEVVDRHANVVLGAGVTPKQGMRLGAAVALGKVGSVAMPYRMLNVEAQYVFNYTRISGEWTRDRFDLPDGESRVSRGVTMQVQQTLSPRLFAHARATMVQSPQHTGPGDSTLQTSASLDTTIGYRMGPALGPGDPTLRTFRSLDTTVGYRIDPDFALRVGYTAIKSFSASSVDHQLAVSLMWAKRWW